MSAGRAVWNGRIQRRVGWIELLIFSSLKWSKTFFVCVLITLRSLLRFVYHVEYFNGSTKENEKKFTDMKRNNIFHLLRKHCYQKREISLCSNTPFPNVTHETAKCETSVERFKITRRQIVHLYSLFDVFLTRSTTVWDYFERRNKERRKEIGCSCGKK